jgi:hypothetical protein
MRHLVPTRIPVLIVTAVTALLLILTGTAWAALQGLAADGSQANDDSAAGIDPARSVSGEDPTNADVVGGSLVAGNLNVPWSVFRQETSAADQVFSRSFSKGTWTTRGAGTVGGRSSASPVFPGSLNFDQGKDGEAPAIDFAGAGRTVPWATWYEDMSGEGFGAENILASRFDQAQNKWIFAGQSRGNGGSGPPVPSLNIHINRDAENPSVAGGATVAGNNPGPWVTWQEEGASAPGTGLDQIFISKPIGPGTTACPAGTRPDSGHNDEVVGGFCWQQVGTERLGGDPSLNVDRGREGIEPDVAFTGPGDTVPWVVWYEQGPAGDVPGGHSNEMVFAAKAVADGTADGGFHWLVVGNAGSGALDNSASGGPCGTSAAVEGSCSLNKDVNADAEDPRVAAGTMNPANPTVPWVAWDEVSGGVDQIFVSRLVGGSHFELANHGAPISVSSNPSTRPDITFAGNTPYVSWREDTGGSVDKAFSGHFVDAADPTFVLDQGDVPLTPTGQADVREPISSGCTANPFNGDGAGCQGGALGTPFFLFTNSIGSRRALFADAYQSGVPATGPPSNVTADSATLNATVNPEGAAASVQFQFGATTAYGQSTSPQRLAPTNAPTPFAANLSGLSAGSIVHYRAIVNTDFGSLVGADQTLQTSTATPNPPKPTKPKPTKPKLRLEIARESLTKLLRTRKLGLTVTLDEGAKLTLTGKGRLKRRRNGHNQAGKSKARAKLVSVLVRKSVSFPGAGAEKVNLTLSRNGRRRLASLRKATLVITGTANATGGGKTTTTVAVTVKR